MDLSEIINEFGENRQDYFNAIAPPIIQTSNFAFETVEALRKGFENEYDGFIYSRSFNPTVNILRKKLAALDKAEDCLVFNSGAAAIFASIFPNVKAGDHIVSVQNPYNSANEILSNILPTYHISTTFIDGTKVENFISAIQSNTKLIYLESPNSWYFDLQDLAAIAEIAKAKNIITVIDNSYCSPIYQQPIKFGIDITLQSATKYLNGHSDVIAGVVCGSNAMMQKIFNTVYRHVGSGIQPFAAWLLLRGLRTLTVRIKQITHTTNEVISFLQKEPLVEKVIFPLLDNFPQLALAKKQMNGACGLVTFFLKIKTVEEIEFFCNSLKHILMAVSWGGYESLIIPKCSTIPKADFDYTNESHRMLRLYVGQEEASYIIHDLQIGFNAIREIQNK
jgi:cystathionine beta-lyase/cystathionine gamma-synthase